MEQFELVTDVTRPPKRSDGFHTSVGEWGMSGAQRPAAEQYRETAEEIRDRVLEAAEYIPPDRLGTTDDCGFAPFSDDTSRTRGTAFDKIRARVAGTALASTVLGVD